MDDPLMHDPLMHSPTLRQVTDCYKPGFRGSTQRPAQVRTRQALVTDCYKQADSGARGVSR
jgi:hypothetical protein